MMAARCLLGVSLLLGVLLPALANCEDALFEYSLQRDSVRDVYIIENQDGFVAGVFLTEQGRRELADVTQFLVGRRLRIVFEGEAVAETLVCDRSDVDRFSVGTFETYEEAAALLRRIAPWVRGIQMIPSGPGPWRKRYFLPETTR